MWGSAVHKVRLCTNFDYIRLSNGSVSYHATLTHAQKYRSCFCVIESRILSLIEVTALITSEFNIQKFGQMFVPSLVIFLEQIVHQQKTHILGVRTDRASAWIFVIIFKADVRAHFYLHVQSSTFGHRRFKKSCSNSCPMGAFLISPLPHEHILWGGTGLLHLVNSNSSVEIDW